MTGVRVQLGIVCGSTDHSATLPVAFVASGVRTTYQPFWARLRPSSSCSSPASERIVTKRSGSSGAISSVLPVAIGSAST